MVTISIGLWGCSIYEARRSEFWEGNIDIHAKIANLYGIFA